MKSQRPITSDDEHRVLPFRPRTTPSPAIHRGGGIVQPLRAAFGELAPRCRELLSMLITDPPLSYAEISATLQIPVGSIGPQRARCLERLRRSRSLSVFMDGETMPAHVGTSGGETGA